jgi:glucosamine--fructose-6-phosphate aminotransferase (isomerizing)
MMMLGSGPSYGTALFAAAKIVEGAGVLAAGQDIEEWWHVERFAHPLDMPLFIIAPLGRSHRRAVEQAEAAGGLGRRIVAVACHDDISMHRHARMVLPVHGDVREEFSPLLYHLHASHVAAHIAGRLGRLPFLGNRRPA